MYNENAQQGEEPWHNEQSCCYVTRRSHAQVMKSVNAWQMQGEDTYNTPAICLFLP
jgi:hypothetical protein